MVKGWSVIHVDPDVVKEIEATVLNKRGFPTVQPAAYYRNFRRDDVAGFCLKRGLYNLPTVELVEWLAKRIEGKRAVEIGAAHGTIAKALGIPAVDNFHQDDRETQQYYRQAGQPTVRYDYQFVKRRDAASYVRRFEPDVVLGCFMTHRYDPERHSLGGNKMGPDETVIIQHCGEYIHMGNDTEHDTKPINALGYEELRLVGLLDRIQNGREHIRIWNGGKQ